MEAEQPDPEPLSARLAAAPFRWAAPPFALWTVTAQVALLAGWSFGALARAYSALLVVLLLALGARARRAWRARRATSGGRPAAGSERGERLAVGCLAALALGGGLLALFAIRPDLDDVGYVSRTVYFLEHPDVPLDLAFHDMGLFDGPQVYPLLLAYTIEPFWGYLAWLGGLPYLTVYHQFVPFLGGLCLPLAWFGLLRRFGGRTPAALLGTVAIVAFLCMDGTPHRSIGNLGFVRIWQGKVLLLSIFVPVFAERSLAWHERPDRRRWLELLLLGTCASGLSSTALVLVPLFAAFLAAGHLAAWGVSRVTMRRVAASFAALGPLIVVALVCWWRTDRTDFAYIGDDLFPGTFAAQARLVFGRDLRPMLALLALSLLGALWATRGWRRRFLAGWAAGAIVLALNPWTMAWASSLTTNNGYWRLFFTFPFPLVLGLAVGRLVPWGMRGALPASLVLLALALGYQYAYPNRATFGGLPFLPGAYKVHPGLQEDVSALLEAAEPGPMIAPRTHSGILPLFTSRHPQVVVRDWTLLHFAGKANRLAEAQSRRNAWVYLTDRRSKRRGLADLERLLVLDLPNVVVSRATAEDPRLAPVLERYGYRLRLELPRLLLYVRPSDDGSARTAPP